MVTPDCDEEDRALRLHERPFREQNSFGLMLLPHENCNFRCVYCYESFARNRMLPEVVEGVVALIKQRLPGLKLLQVGWFGGEPLLAMDVIEEISSQVRPLCAEEGTIFTASMTTNGYLLDSSYAARCIASGVGRFQITLDGPGQTHDTTRVLAGGGPTFERVLGNLRGLRDRANGFKAAIRVNFTPANLPLMPEFITFLGTEFGNDPRFSMRFRPVGRWGGPNDAQLEICEHGSGADLEIGLMELAMAAGFSLDTWKEGMQPFGSTCYAASPRHLVIGSDGTIYKCTVAFDDPRNHVGKLQANGDLNLREDLIRLWTRSGEETDTGCQACAFRPACQGNLCPLERIEGRPKRCPTSKTHTSLLLPLLARDARRAAIAVG